ASSSKQKWGNLAKSSAGAAPQAPGSKSASASKTAKALSRAALSGARSRHPARIGKNEHLESLQHPVVRQRVRGLFQIDRQLVRLDAAEDGCAQVRDADVAASDAVRIETLIAVPRF